MYDNPLSWLVTGTSAGFTIVLKHSAPLARGHLPAKKKYGGFLLMWCNFKILTIPKFPEPV
jgi:hypothetical protein